MADEPNASLTVGIDRHGVPWVAKGGDDGGTDAVALTDPVRLLAGSLGTCLA